MDLKVAIQVNDFDEMIEAISILENIGGCHGNRSAWKKEKLEGRTDNEFPLYLCTHTLHPATQLEYGVSGPGIYTSTRIEGDLETYSVANNMEELEEICLRKRPRKIKLNFGK